MTENERAVELAASSIGTAALVGLLLSAFLPSYLPPFLLALMFACACVCGHFNNKRLNERQKGMSASLN